MDNEGVPIDGIPPIDSDSTDDPGWNWGPVKLTAPAVDQTKQYALKAEATKNGSVEASVTRPLTVMDVPESGS